MAGKRAKMVAVSGDLDPKHFLGRLATWSLPEETRSGAKLVRSWHANGLDVDDLPEARQPVHVFQSACASVNARATTNKKGQRMEVRADPIENNGRVSYQITVKVWDLANRVIEHEKALRVNFDKRASAISFDHLGFKDPTLRDLEKRIRKDFEDNAKTVPAQKVRNAITRVMRQMGAQKIIKGLHFIPVSYVLDGKSVETKKLLDGIAGVIHDLYPEKGQMYQIPVASEAGAAEMIRERFVVNANERAEEAATRAWQRVHAGRGERGVRADMLANLHNERRSLMHEARQFEQLVNVEQKDIAANLKDLDAALAALDELNDSEENDA